MNLDELRGAQTPLKIRYRDQPATALITLGARGTPVVTEQVCRVETHNGIVEAGLHPATGGDGTKACSADMLLQALVGCAGVTLGAVATSMAIDIRGGTIRAEGEVDFRGTLGVGRDAPVGFTHIRLEFALDTDAPHDKLAKLIQLTERYCVVYQTLKRPPETSSMLAPAASGAPTPAASGAPTPPTG